MDKPIRSWKTIKRIANRSSRAESRSKKGKNIGPCWKLIEREGEAIERMAKPQATRENVRNKRKNARAQLEIDRHRA